ncbi:glycosyltransferase [Opitutales bacterium]|nr:glycosyltransferase [Opitutales bacterium]
MKEPLNVSVIVLYFNDVKISETIKSLENQTIKPKEIIIIDDYSDIPINENLVNPNCRIIRNTRNMGRGHSRNLGIKECKSEFVVFCDSSNSLCENFIEKALSSLANKNISAVFGRIIGNEDHTDICSKWRERNLFLETYPSSKLPYEVKSLSTYSVMLRKSHILSVGNFAQNLRQFEDHDLGERILKQGYKILFDPLVHCISNKRDNLFQLATRVDRWYSPSSEGLNLKSFNNLLKTALSIWAKRDIQSRELSGVMISLSLPFIILSQNLTNDHSKN